MGKEIASPKRKKIHEDLNSTGLDHWEKNLKRSCKWKNKKNPSKPEPDDFKQNAIK